MAILVLEQRGGIDPSHDSRTQLQAIPDLMSDHVMSEHQLQQLQGPGLQETDVRFLHLISWGW